MVADLFSRTSTNLKFNLGSYMTTTLGTKNGNSQNQNLYFAKKGEPVYKKDMDADEDGVITFDEFRAYCKTNNLSSKEISDMMEIRNAYLMTKDVVNKTDSNNYKPGTLDLIYANDGDDKYDEAMDLNKDSRISYKEYLRYCEQNAKTEEKTSDTKIITDKSQFTTVSFGHASKAYNKFEINLPQGKIESNI